MGGSGILNVFAHKVGELTGVTTRPRLKMDTSTTKCEMSWYHCQHALTSNNHDIDLERKWRACTSLRARTREPKRMCVELTRSQESELSVFWGGSGRFNVFAHKVGEPTGMTTRPRLKMGH